jgi:hypothetical protein
METSGDVREERLEAYQQLWQTSDIVEELAGMESHDRAVAYARVQAALKRAAPIGDLKRAVTEALKQRVQAGAGKGGLFGQQIPPGWRMEDDNIVRVLVKDGEETSVLVSKRPIMVTGRAMSPDTEEHHLRLTWRRTGRRDAREAVVSRGILGDGRTLAALSKDGAPVIGSRAAEVAKFLEACEIHNEARLPTAYLASSLGWQGTGEKRGGIEDRTSLGFLAGRTLVQGGKLIDVEDTWQQNHVTLSTSSEGLNQLACAVRTGGSRAESLAMVAECVPFPVVMLGIYGALAAPLLTVIPGAPNYIMDNYGETGLGKTTISQVGASMWGPGLERGGGPIKSWGSTSTGVEGHARASGSGVPVFLNDSQQAYSPELVIRILYMLYNGMGGLRGDVSANSRATSSWRTGAIVNGERPIVSFGLAGGTRTRVLEIGRLPFGEGDNQELVDDLKATSCESFGWFGLEMVQWLDNNRDSWPGLRDAYSDGVARWKAKIPGRIASRHAQTVALLELTAGIAHLRLGLPGDPAEAMRVACEEAIDSSADADLGKTAARLMFSWASQNQNRFYPRDVRANEYLGKWDPLQPDELAINDAVCRQILERNNFNPEAVIGNWNGRGWLNCSKGHRTSKRRVNRTQTRCYCLNAKAWEDATGSVPEPEKPDDYEWGTYGGGE